MVYSTPLTHPFSTNVFSPPRLLTTALFSTDPSVLRTNNGMDTTPAPPFEGTFSSSAPHSTNGSSSMSPPSVERTPTWQWWNDVVTWPKLGVIYRLKHQSTDWREKCIAQNASTEARQKVWSTKGKLTTLWHCVSEFIIRSITLHSANKFLVVRKKSRKKNPFFWGDIVTTPLISRNDNYFRSR